MEQVNVEQTSDGMIVRCLWRHPSRTGGPHIRFRQTVVEALQEHLPAGEIAIAVSPISAAPRTADAAGPRRYAATVCEQWGPLLQRERCLRAVHVRPGAADSGPGRRRYGQPVRLMTLSTAQWHVLHDFKYWTERALTAVLAAPAEVIAVYQRLNQLRLAHPPVRDPSPGHHLPGLHPFSGITSDAHLDDGLTGLHVAALETLNDAWNAASPAQRLLLSGLGRTWEGNLGELLATCRDVLDDPAGGHLASGWRKAS